MNGDCFFFCCFNCIFRFNNKGNFIEKKYIFIYNNIIFVLTNIPINTSVHSKYKKE